MAPVAPAYAPLDTAWAAAGAGTVEPAPDAPAPDAPDRGDPAPVEAVAPDTVGFDGAPADGRLSLVRPLPKAPPASATTATAAAIATSERFFISRFSRVEQS